MNNIICFLFFGTLSIVYGIVPNGVCTPRDGSLYTCTGSFVFHGADSGSYVPIDSILTSNGNFTLVRSTRIKPVVGPVKAGTYTKGRSFTRQKVATFGNCGTTTGLFQGAAFVTVPTPAPWTVSANAVNCTLADSTAPCYPYVIPRIDVVATDDALMSTAGAYLYADTVSDTIYDRMSENSSFPITMTVDQEGVISVITGDLLSPPADYSLFRATLKSSSKFDVPPAILSVTDDEIIRAVRDEHLLSLFPQGDWTSYGQGATFLQRSKGWTINQEMALADKFQSMGYFYCPITDVNSVPSYYVPQITYNTTTPLLGYTMAANGQVMTLTNSELSDLQYIVEYTVVAKPAPATVTFVSGKVTCAPNPSVTISYDVAGGLADKVVFDVWHEGDATSIKVSTDSVLGRNDHRIYGTCTVLRVCHKANCLDLTNHVATAKAAVAAAAESSSVPEDSAVWLNPNGNASLFAVQVGVIVLIGTVLIALTAWMAKGRLWGKKNYVAVKSMKDF